MPELNRIVKSGGDFPSRQPAAAERIEMPKITVEVLDRIPFEYHEGLLWMANDAPGLVDENRIAVAVGDAVRVLSSVGKRLKERGFTSSDLFRIKPEPIAYGDYAASRRLRFEDDIGADLPIQCSSTAGLCWRLNGGEITHIGYGTAFFTRPNGQNCKFGGD